MFDRALVRAIRIRRTLILDDNFENAGTVIDLVLADDKSFRKHYADRTLGTLGATDWDGNRIVEVGPLESAVDARRRKHIVVCRPPE